VTRKKTVFVIFNNSVKRWPILARDSTTARSAKRVLVIV